MLDLLCTFLAVYRAGSIRAGARASGVSQPAASTQMRSLEHVLGTTLFERSAVGVMPTAAADVLARDIAAPIDGLQSTMHRWSGVGGLPARPFLLGGPSDLLAERIVQDLAPLLSSGLRIHLEIGLTEDLLEKLDVGGLDAVVALRRPRSRGLSAVALTDESLVLVARPGLTEPASVAREPRTLDTVPVVAFNDSLPLFRRFWKVAFNRSPQMSPVLVVPDLRALRRACLAGVGATVLPTYLVSADLATGRLVELYRYPDGVINTIWFVTKQRASPHPHEEVLRQRIAASARQW